MTSNHTFSRDRSTWLAYLLLAFYGYCLNILGPITPFLKEELALTYTVSSLHFTAFATGILLVGLGGHVVIRQIGPWRSLWIGALGLTIGGLALVAGRSPLLTISAAFCMGLVGSLILVIVPSTLADKHQEQRAVALAEANVVASLVSAAAPLMVGWSVRCCGEWRLALGAAALTPLLLGVAVGRDSHSQPTAAQKSQPQQSGGLPILYWLFWVAIVLAVSVEFCMVFWSADYLENVLGLLRVDAAQAITLFLGAMIAGRLAGSRLVQRFSTLYVVVASILVAGAGFLLFWSTKSAILGMLGLFVTGLGVASLYPLLLSLAIGAAGSSTVQASVRATLASGTAILTLPLVLGRLADAFGIRQAFGIVALLLVAVLVIVVSAGGITRGQRV